MIDVCGGNRARRNSKGLYAIFAEDSADPRGNFSMCKAPTNPIDYITDNNLSNIFRFILTHPDMDHLDGFNNLLNATKIQNFWHTGTNKDTPDFSDQSYNRDDWDRYIDIKNQRDPNITVVTPLSGSKFSFANSDDHSGLGDCLSIVSPSPELVADANYSQEFNDSSYIIVYRSAGGKIVIPGDAEDGGWEYAISQYPTLMKDVKFLLAPHHGRDSNRDRRFLNHLQPKLTLLGCAPSKHMAYDAWNNRALDYITQNQTGNVILNIGSGEIDIFIENDKYASEYNNCITWPNDQGYYYLKTI